MCWEVHNAENDNKKVTPNLINSAKQQSEQKELPEQRAEGASWAAGTTEGGANPAGAWIISSLCSLCLCLCLDTGTLVAKAIGWGLGWGLGLGLRRRRRRRHYWQKFCVCFLGSDRLGLGLGLRILPGIVDRGTAHFC